MNEIDLYSFLIGAYTCFALVVIIEIINKKRWFESLHNKIVELMFK